MECFIPATVRNMRDLACPGLVALDPSSGETFSATPGDYFMCAEDEEMRGADGEPLVLAARVPAHFEPLKALTSA